MALHRLEFPVNSQIARPDHVEIVGLSKWYDIAGGRMIALDDLHLTIRAGEFISILGPSGCGKSTLLMLLAGLTVASAGRVVVDGQIVSRPLTDVGVVFQKDLLFDWRTVLGNVMLQAEIRNLDRTGMKQKARDLLSMVGLSGYEDRRPWELSGGMRQRVALCRALLHDASMLLMDEPFGALDAITRDQINADLQQIWLSQQRTAVMVTHSISEAIFLSDRVIAMSPRPGRIAYETTIDLPRPRTVAMRDTPEFAKYQGTLREAISH